jgi:hypothetical protein
MLKFFSDLYAAYCDIHGFQKFGATIFLLAVVGMAYQAVSGVLRFFGSHSHRHGLQFERRQLRHEKNDERRRRKIVARREVVLGKLAAVEQRERQVAATESLAALRARLTWIRHDPDFRRCTAAAQACVHCPGDDLRYVFNAHRSELLDQLIIWLSGGADSHHILTTLRELVVALRLPAFEADYLYESARQYLAQHYERRHKSNFAQQVLDESLMHAERVSTIEALKDDPETVEQLLEIEQGRHADVLTQLASAQHKGGDGVVTL